MKPIQIVLSKPFEKLQPRSSHFWGDPALPQGLEYPCYIDDEGDEYPYTFVCQINLEDISTYDKGNRLPHSGLLLFFAKIDHYMGYFAATDCVGGYVSDRDAVKVLYFPSCENLEEIVLLDEDDNPLSPEELEITFGDSFAPLSDEHGLFMPPTHREWENWDSPYKDWEILLQVDSFDGTDFHLNFMDCGVLDFLISPADLIARNFDNIRAIVLST